MIFPLLLGAYALVGAALGAKSIAALPKAIAVFDGQGKEVGSHPPNAATYVKVMGVSVVAWPLLVIAKP